MGHLVQRGQWTAASKRMSETRNVHRSPCFGTSWRANANRFIVWRSNQEGAHEPTSVAVRGERQLFRNAAW